LPACARVDNEDGEHGPQDFPDEHVTLISSAVSIGLAFGFIVGLGSGVFFSFYYMPAIIEF
jgi:hypothetical protein